ncbi:MAG TPA: lanthionine synthetase LanC family protein [Streptosporangiaceae bacterium]|nr:lanthionine synthetase LanC family protein [Streptosporangiaceae bacterium]
MIAGTANGLIDDLPFGMIDYPAKGTISPAWDKTMLIWLPDEHGGYYDQVPPPAAVPPDDVLGLSSFERYRIMRLMERDYAEGPRPGQGLPEVICVPAASGADRHVVGCWPVSNDSDLMTEATGAAIEALRWVADAAMPAQGGASWPETRTAGAQTADDLYDGTAGVLMAFAEAELSGVPGFGEPAAAAAGRLRWIAEAGQENRTAPVQIQIPGEPDSPVTSLYTGLSGIAAALAAWAAVTGDEASAKSASTLITEIGEIVVSGPDSGVRDIIEGDAGTLAVLADLGGEPARPAASLLADRLVAEARWRDGGPDWTARPGDEVLAPNFSHGSSGVAFALAKASGMLGRPDLLEIAAAAGRRLISLGQRPDGTLAVPVRFPPKPGWPDLAYGWCHGPTGTMRLFEVLNRLQPEERWADAVDGCLAAIRFSGLPERRFPGFWDNVGQCCGSAGVGELMLDRYQETSDSGWLEFADELARDVLSRRIEDAAGVRWSNTEFRADPPELEPIVGLMQGAPGVAGWLLRLARVHQDGPGACRVRWPDRP